MALYFLRIYNKNYNWKLVRDLTTQMRRWSFESKIGIINLSICLCLHSCHLWNNDHRISCPDLSGHRWQAVLMPCFEWYYRLQARKRSRRSRRVVADFRRRRPRRRTSDPSFRSSRSSACRMCCFSASCQNYVESWASIVVIHCLVNCSCSGHRPELHWARRAGRARS